MVVMKCTNALIVPGQQGISTGNKGEANMTAASFCKRVNTELLPFTTLPANYPRSISLHTATRWLHRLGFRPLGHKKGAYVDGNEREEVIAYHKEYLKVMHNLYQHHLVRMNKPLFQQQMQRQGRKLL